MMDIKEEIIEKQSIAVKTTFTAFLAMNETSPLWQQLSAVSGIAIFSLVRAVTSRLWMLHYLEFEDIISSPDTDTVGIFHLRLALLMRILGTIVAGFSMYFIGRKINIRMASILDLLATVILVSNLKLEIMFAGYLLSEFAWGYMIVIFYVYVAEITDPHFRVSIMGINELLSNIPLLLSHKFIVTHRIFSVTMCLILSSLSIVLSMSAPESPYWLALTGRREKAENLFYYLHPNTVDSTEIIILCDEAERDAMWKATGVHKIVSSPQFLVPLLIMFFMIFSCGNMLHFGNGSISNLIPIVRSEYHDLWQFWNSYYVDNYINYFLIISVIAFLWLALKIPRRVLFISSVLLGLLIIVPHLIASLMPSRFLIAFCLYTYPLLYLFAYLGGSQLLRIIPVEIFPGPGRDLGSSIYFIFEVILDGLSTGVINLDLIHVTIIELRWFMFPFGLLFTILFMPETKDLSLVDAHQIGSDLKEKLFFTIDEKDEIIY